MPDPRNPPRPQPSRLPHTRADCPPIVLTLATGSGSPVRTRTPAHNPTLAWQPEAIARWASDPDTDTTGHRPIPTGWSPARAVPGSVDRGSPHTETLALPAWHWREPDYQRQRRAMGNVRLSNARWHRAWSRARSCRCTFFEAGVPSPHIRADVLFPSKSDGHCDALRFLGARATKRSPATANRSARENPASTRRASSGCKVGAVSRTIRRCRSASLSPDRARTRCRGRARRVLPTEPTAATRASTTAGRVLSAWEV